MKKIKIIMKIGMIWMGVIGFMVLLHHPRVHAEENLIKYAKSAILIEAESGEVLYEYNAHARYEPASMTKIMTMKLILDAYQSKRITKDQMITTSEYASSMGGSQIYLAAGETMPAEDLFKSMVIASANDAAVALTEAISGSEKFFVAQMNDEVKKLGLKNTHFSNATGLPTENHYSSSYDMAMMARNLLLKYETQIIPYTSTYEDYVRKNTDKPFWLVNTNKLIKHVEGIDGLKTGWTETAGYCLTCTKSSNGMRLISVVMSADTVPHRSEDTLSLLNYGFANFEKLVIIRKGTNVKNESNILLDPSEYQIITSKDIVKIVKKGGKVENPTFKIDINQNAIQNLQQYQIGKMKVYLGNQLLDETDLELVIKPKKNSFFSILLEILKQIF